MIYEGVMEGCSRLQDQEMVTEHSRWLSLRWLSDLIKVYRLR